MATITVRNVPEELVNRIKQLADNKGVSMEQEIRDLLKSRYESRNEVLDRIRKRWDSLPVQSEELIQEWKEQGRP